MTGIPSTERSLTNSVAALFKEQDGIMKTIFNHDHYFYLRNTNGIKGQHHQHHGQRRLEDSYAYDSSSTIQEQQQQHPWYSHVMLIVLIVLITFTIAYSTYQLYQSRQIRSILNKAHCATRPLCDDDMSDVYSMQQSSVGSAPEWKNTTQIQMEMATSSSRQPSRDDDNDNNDQGSATAVSLSPKNHNEDIAMSGGSDGQNSPTPAPNGVAV
jgi:hypothetical protein